MLRLFDCPPEVHRIPRCPPVPPGCSRVRSLWRWHEPNRSHGPGRSALRALRAGGRVCAGGGQRAGTSSGPRVQAGSSNRSGRWVRTRSVRPSVAAGRSARKARAAGSSRCSVGSSRTRIRTSARSARASARRCRWPPDSRAPCSPTGVSRPSGSAATQSSRRACSRARSSSSDAGARSRQPEVVGDRRVEDVRVLGAQPDGAADVVAGDRADVDGAPRPRPAPATRPRDPGTAGRPRPACSCRSRSGR